MSWLTSLGRWWHRGQTARLTQSPRRRSLLTIDFLETRTVPSTSSSFVLPTGFTPDTGTLGDGITNQRTLTLQGQGSPGTVFNLYANNVYYTKGTVGNDGSWSLLVPRTLNNATYTFKTQPVDNLTNTAAGGTLQVKVDLTKPLVSLTPVVYQVGMAPQVKVKGVDVNGTVQVAIDVDLDGNRTFTGAGEMNQTVAALTSGQLTTINLNSFTKYRPYYYIRARVLDVAGNEGTSALTIWKGPQPDKVALKVPTSTTGPTYTATVQVTKGLGNGFQPGVAVDIDLDKDNVFEANEEYVTGTLNSLGQAALTMSGLVPSTYKVRARITDLLGNTAVSPTQVMKVLDDTPANAKPLVFEPNQGQVEVDASQTDPNVQFVVRPRNSSIVYLTPSSLTFSVTTKDSSNNDIQVAQSVQLANCNTGVIGVGQDLLASTSNYFLGNTTLANIPNFSQVLFANVYEGIDLTYNGDTGQLEYKFTVKPGASVDAIRLQFPSGVSLSLDSIGWLVVDLPEGQQIVNSLPLSYQVGPGGVLQAVPSHFVLLGNNQVGFALGDYDVTRSVIIDPFIFTNFLSSGAADTAGGLTIDSRGNIYVIGSAAGANYPSTITTIPPPPFGGTDVVVTKFNSSGNIVYSTYIGGDQADTGNAIAVDSAGYAYLTGRTLSVNGGAGDLPFPDSVGSFPPAGGADAFVTILRPNGTLYSSTLLGGNLADAGTAIALDGFNNIWVAGTTLSTNASLPGPLNIITNGVLGGQDIFLAKFNRLDLSAATGFQFMDRIGGFLAESAARLMVDNINRVYLVGQTASGDFPITAVNAYITTRPALAGSGYLCRFLSDGSLDYGTYLGGTTNNNGVPTSNANGVFVNANYDIAVTGTTNTNNFFQVTPTGFLSTRFPTQADNDAYILKLHIQTTSTTQLAGTYFGNAFSDENGTAIAMDSKNNLYLYGQWNDLTKNNDKLNTKSVSLLKNPILKWQGNTDSFVAVFNPTATSLLLSTSLGGAGTDSPVNGGLAVDGSGTIYLTGTTTNTTSFQTAVKNTGASSTIFGNGGAASGNDIFVSKIGRVTSQALGNDIFELNDTSNVARPIDRYVNAGLIANLTTARHSNMLFDYDWYKLTASQSGVLTVNLSNISVFASGPSATAGNGGDLHLYVYKVVNGFLYELSRSTISQSNYQQVAVNVTKGENIVFLVNPLNFTQATYTMNITLT